MDKGLTLHRKLVLDEIEKLEKALAGAKTAGEREKLASKVRELSMFHAQRVRDFQHERLVHLIITLFFGSVLLLSVVCLFAVSALPLPAATISLVSIFTACISVILLAVELFYIRYYYKLENGTQSLYVLSQRLHDLR